MCACTEPVRTGIGPVCVEYGRPTCLITMLNQTRVHVQKNVLFFLFERSEFLIDTSQKKNLCVCVCSANLGFSDRSANRIRPKNGIPTPVYIHSF